MTTSTPLDAAMRLLARRAHGRSELAQKLRRRGFSADDIETALNRAVELELMPSDADTAVRFAEELARKPGATPRWVRQKLAARGFESSISRTAIDAAFANWDARAAASDYAGADKNPARVARRLERKGFSADVIGWTVRRLKSDAEET